MKRCAVFTISSRASSSLSGRLLQLLKKTRHQEVAFSCAQMLPKIIRGYINGNTTSGAHSNSTRNSYINLISVLKRRLNRGFDKHVFLLILDLSAQTCSQSLKKQVSQFSKACNKFKSPKRFLKLNMA